MYPRDLKYSKEHEWVRVDGDLAKVGITEFAAEKLGEIVYFEAPEVGTSYNQGDELGSVESVKAVSEVYSPLSGEVVEVNEAIDDSPELVNEEPHGDGWLCVIKYSNADELDELMDASDYQDFIANEEE